MDSLFRALGKKIENNKIIANFHLKAVLEFERIFHESFKELRRLADAISKNIRALNNLGFEKK